MRKTEKQVEALSNPQFKREGAGPNYTAPLRRGRMSRSDKINHAYRHRQGA